LISDSFQVIELSMRGSSSHGAIPIPITAAAAMARKRNGAQATSAAAEKAARGSSARP
jgi:hypothetical protein